MNNYQLNTKWSLWYHSINDNNWNNKSYKNLYNINNLFDLKIINDSIMKNHLQNGMFFIMKEDIFPTWEDPDNREGCCISFKIYNSVLIEQWNLILNSVITQDILKDINNEDLLNGISISPKKEFNIIKIWLRYNNKEYKEFFKQYEPYFLYEKSLLKKHELSN